MLLLPGLAGLRSLDVQLDRMPVGGVLQLEAVERGVAQAPCRRDDPLRAGAGKIDLLAPDVGAANEDVECRLAGNRLDLGRNRPRSRRECPAPPRRYNNPETASLRISARRRMFSPEQYRALREGAGLVDRSDRGRLALDRQGSPRLSAGPSEQRHRRAHAGTGCYASLLTAQGRMICRHVRRRDWRGHPDGSRTASGRSRRRASRAIRFQRGRRGRRTSRSSRSSASSARRRQTSSCRALDLQRHDEVSDLEQLTVLGQQRPHPGTDGPVAWSSAATTSVDRIRPLDFGRSSVDALAQAIRSRPVRLDVEAGRGRDPPRRGRPADLRQGHDRGHDSRSKPASRIGRSARRRAATSDRRSSSACCTVAMAAWRGGWSD